MHLTNYSVNKHNEFYERNVAMDSGSKRSIRYFNEYLRHNDIDVAMLWRNIADMITKTLIVSEPHVLHAYRMCRPGVPSHSDSVCFEVLGFDIMIDRKLRPWLIEVSGGGWEGGLLCVCVTVCVTLCKCVSVCVTVCVC